MNGTGREKRQGHTQESQRLVPALRLQPVYIHPTCSTHNLCVRAVQIASAHPHMLPTKMIAVALDTLQYAYGLLHRHAATSPSPFPRLAGTRVSHTIFLPVRLRPCRDTQGRRTGPPMQRATRQARKPLLFHGTRGACQDFPALRYGSSVW